MNRPISRLVLWLLALAAVGVGVSCRAHAAAPSRPEPARAPVVLPNPVQPPPQGTGSQVTAMVTPAPPPPHPAKLVLDGSVLMFRSGGWEQNPKGLKALHEAVAKARSAAFSTVVVAGYSSSLGSRIRGISVSRHRAEFIAKSLAAAGITPKKITVKAFGSDSPVADNATQAGRLKNKRVEIEFLDH